MVVACRCPLCKQKTDTVIADQLRCGLGRVYYCALCQHGFLVTGQTADAKQYYAELYRKEHSHNAEATPTNARELFDVYRRYQKDRLAMVSPFLQSDTALLEVGASSGQFVFHIKDRVKKVNAIELDKDCCRFLQSELGIWADSEFLRDSVFAGETYDVVCSFQVMEHVDDPISFLRDLRLSTKKGGIIFIEVPNLGDPLLTVWGVNSYRKFFYHSAHLHYFTEASLARVAGRAGFRPDEVEISFTQDYNLLNHLHWIMNDGPQADCHIGLSEISLRGTNREISSWLTEEMNKLNTKYMEKLIEAKCTSNMMMKLRNEE